MALTLCYSRFCGMDPVSPGVLDRKGKNKRTYLCCGNGDETQFQCLCAGLL